MKKIKITKSALLMVIDEFALIQNRGGYNHYSFDDCNMPLSVEIPIEDNE